MFIYNPNAGKAKIKSSLSDIVQEFSSRDFDVIVKPTGKRGDATEFAREYAENGEIERIVCSGGDGTLNEVVTGVLQSGKRIPIGFIPAGTTNDFSYSIRIPKDIVKAAALAAAAEPMPSDAGTINGRTFVYTASFGLFSDVSYDTPQNMKNILGRMAYILSGAKSLHNVKVYTMKVSYESLAQNETKPVDERECVSMQTEGEFICGMISNSDSVGGFKGIMGREVEFDDGVFEMVLIRKPHGIIDLTGIINELLSKNLNSPNIVYAHVRSVKVENEGELPWSLDGEFGGNMPLAEIHILKQAVDYLRLP